MGIHRLNHAHQNRRLTYSRDAIRPTSWGNLPILHAVPVHLHGHYGKTRIRQSLNTKDERDAMREGEKLPRKYHAEFKALSQGVETTSADTVLAGKALAEQYSLDEFINHVIDPLRARYAQG